MSRKKRRSLIFPFLFFFLFFVFVLAGRSERESPWYERAFWWMISVPERAVTTSGQWVSGAWNHYVALIDTAKENEHLSREVARLQGKVVAFAELKQENARLRGLLQYREEAGASMLTARVIGNDPRAQFKSLVINRGKVDGLKLLQPVLAGEGLVGRVAKLGKHSSLVLLLTDPNSAVDVVVQRSRARALLVGNPRGEVGSTKLEYLQRKFDVQSGDVAVTSGFDAVYPPGLPVGKVVNVQSSDSDVFHEVEVSPFVRFESLQEVTILLQDQHNYE